MSYVDKMFELKYSLTNYLPALRIFEIYHATNETFSDFLEIILSGCVTNG